MKKYRIKWKNVFIAISILIVIIILIINPIKIYNKNRLVKLNYTKESASLIVKYGLVKETLDKEYSEFVDNHISDKDFDIKKYSNYLELKNTRNIDMKLINKLIEKSYSNSDINSILLRGNNDSISALLNKDKYDNISDYLKYDYAKLKNIDRYIEYKASNVVSYKDCVIYVNLNLDLEPYEEVENVNKFSYTMLVNKHFMLDSDFVPDNLEKIPSEYGYVEATMEKEALDAYIEMYNAMKSENNLRLYASNGYRSYEDQKKIYNPKNSNSFKEGSSEHQTGLAISISSRVTDNFGKSEEKKWLDSNAYKYGFIYRFPNNKEEITGYSGVIYQYRYVGRDAAKVIYNNKLTLEEYYAMYVDIE